MVNSCLYDAACLSGYFSRFFFATWGIVGCNTNIRIQDVLLLVFNGSLWHVFLHVCCYSIRGRLVYRNPQIYASASSLDFSWIYQNLMFISVAVWSGPFSERGFCSGTLSLFGVWILMWQFQEAIKAGRPKECGFCVEKPWFSISIVIIFLFYFGFATFTWCHVLKGHSDLSERLMWNLLLF